MYLSPSNAGRNALVLSGENDITVIWHINTEYKYNTKATYRPGVFKRTFPQAYSRDSFRRNAAAPVADAAVGGGRPRPRSAPARGSGRWRRPRWRRPRWRGTPALFFPHPSPSPCRHPRLLSLPPPPYSPPVLPPPHPLPRRPRCAAAAPCLPDRPAATAARLPDQPPAAAGRVCPPGVGRVTLTPDRWPRSSPAVKNTRRIRGVFPGNKIPSHTSQSKNTDKKTLTVHRLTMYAWVELPLSGTRLLGRKNLKYADADRN